MANRTNLTTLRVISVFLVALGAAATAAGGTIYVDADASGANNGSSWTNAYRYLQNGLAAAWSGDEIRVAQGIYKPDQGAGVTPGDRTATFQLINGVAVKGGYAGFGQPDPDARDIEVYETVLSGDLNGDDGPDFANNDENSYHVLTGSGTNETAVLDGFTITAGNANGSKPNNFGGGMINDSGSPTLSDCTFRGNYASYAAGMANRYGSSPTLTNCTFKRNSGYSSGGMHNWNGSDSTLVNCTFSENSTRYAGGMKIYRSNPTLTNCTFSRNSAWQSSGAVSILSSSPRFTNCRFSGNSAPSGGAITTTWSSPTLTNCTITGNKADTGGGIWINDGSSPMLTNCTFAGNSAIHGNALACDSYSNPSNVELANCILWDGGDEIWNNDNSAITITYSDVQGGWPDEGNIDDDPCFVEPEYLGPISHWKFDEGEGTTAYDSAGNNDGTVYGAQWTTGQIDGALSFDGVDDYAGIAWDESLANVADNFTILLWAQPLSTHQIDPERNSGTSGTRGQKYAISARHGDYHWGSGHAGAGISIGTNGISVYEHAADYMPALLVWSGSVSGFTHVAVVYSDKQPRLYIDGESKKTGLQSSKIVHILSNIGGHRYGYFNGLIDDVRIYDRALSAEEIQQLYQIGLTGHNDYHLLPDSPCINAGDPNYVAEPNETDLDGNPRVIGGRIDMGADEVVIATMKFTPQALNPDSRGNWVKAHFVLPEGFGVDDVDTNSPAKVEPFGIESEYINVFVNEDGLVEIEAAFGRAAFCGAATGYGPVEVTVVGLLTSGQYFYGTDTIKIINKSFEYLGVLASHWLEGGCGAPDWCGGVDLDHNSLVDLVDFAMFDGCCIEVIRQ